MVKITFCICTRRRPFELSRLLESIHAMTIPSDIDLSIVVVENDVNETVRSLVEDFSLKTGLKANYYLECSQGISYARNRSVKEAGDCDFCIFVDDDQIVDKSLLYELIRCQIEFSPDGVSGYTPPIFSGKVAPYVEKFHQDEKIPYGTRVKKAATGCLLLRKKMLDAVDGPFELRYNFTGGEDYFMTHRITSMGGVIISNPSAISYEMIPPERTTFRYIARRTFRTSNTKLFIESFTDSKFSAYKRAMRLILRLAYGTFLIVPSLIFRQSGRLDGVIKVVDAIGGLMFVLGKRNKFYK